jgi:hypothetical protein
MTRRFISLFALALSVSCAKANREAAPAAKTPSAEPATAAEPAPSAAAATPAPEPVTATETPGMPAPKEKSPPKKSEDRLSRGPSSLSDEPKTVAEAEARLAESEEEIQQLLKVNKGRGGAASPLSTGDARCAQACKAFFSLKRAADAVCRLAGDKDARCTRARGVVKENEGRVQACSCSSDDD